MKPLTDDSRIGVVGASTLAGKELLSLLEESRFANFRLVTVDVDEADLDLPVVDLTKAAHEVLSEPSGTSREFDAIFIASLPRATPAWIRAALETQAPGGDLPTVVIDMTGRLRTFGREILTVPFLERGLARPEDAKARAGARLFGSPHPAAIVLSAILLRIASKFSVASAAAQIFAPASEFGSRAVEELQKQAVSLLSFKEPPREIFGGQLAFNLLPRLGGEQNQRMEELEKRIRADLRGYLGGRAPIPAVRLLAAPIFYSLALSLFVEVAGAPDPAAIAAALEGKPLRARHLSASSPMDAAGTDDVLLDVIHAGPDRPQGVWIWAAADNVRLAAHNAIAIAEDLL